MTELHVVRRMLYVLWCALSFAGVVFVDGSVPKKQLQRQRQRQRQRQQPQEPRSVPSQILLAKIPSLESSSRESQQQLWLYEGALYDPLDGRRIAQVRGLELVRPVEDTTHLAIDGLLNHPNATYEDSKTVWSQKIFCYTTTNNNNQNNSSNNNNNGKVLSSSSETNTKDRPLKGESILDSVRIRPRSPRKQVPLDQAVVVYETATTFVARNKTTTTTAHQDENENENENENDEEILVHSEWPNGQTMWGKAARDRGIQRTGMDAAAAAAASAGSIDFTVFAKLRNKNSPLYAPDLGASDDQQQQQQGSSKTSGDVIVSPKRAALVQFGSSSGKLESKHKFGARETYSYRNLPNPGDGGASATSNKMGWFSSILRKNRPRGSSSATKKKFRNRNNNNNDGGLFGGGPTLYYTRYGEAPPFYAPGRMCMLELRGRPVRNLGEVGPLLRGLLLGGSDGDTRSSDGTQTQGHHPPLVANFRWRENDSKPPTDEDDSALESRTSLQTAWNLRQRSKRRSSVSIDGRELPLANRQSRRRRPFEQPLVLRLAKERTEDPVLPSGRWKKFAKNTRKLALQARDRIRASTTLEARS